MRKKKYSKYSQVLVYSSPHKCLCPSFVVPSCQNVGSQVNKGAQNGQAMYATWVFAIKTLTSPKNTCP